ncbi:G-protein coupled receptor Mth isoform X2 [Drosophila biarmipes]|uniref:G-protein coupled receptor Mth isoform X2 n=1 Tax=Drosophila biarmipes TaxID=125945 RepID=UPI0007E87227|nr:G-protein coupled receptor Mth isoform X2 [Drosophila biarmipes]
MRIFRNANVLFLYMVFSLSLILLPKTEADIADCDFFETVDISAGHKFPNGSYLYDGLLVPAELTGRYDFRILPDDSKEKVQSHIRGCVCKLKPCVRFCCPHNHIMKEGVCSKTMSQEELKEHDPYLNVTLQDGSVVTRHFKNELIVQWDLPMPCENMFYLDNEFETDQYTLFENGSFIRHHDNATLNKREYCLQHFEFESEEKNTFIRIVPHNCYIVPSRTAQTVVIITSLVCMALTMCVYLYVKKLQNLHGKCFLCYMLCLFMGYLFLLLDLWTLLLDFCRTAGFLGYFFVMAAFFWLSVISLHLWNTFSGTSHSINRFLPEHRFLAYNTYAWGMALILTGITFVADKMVANEEWNPRMGIEGNCWIYTLDWSAMLYFYGPMVLMIAFNMVMFILTAGRIIRVKKDIRNFAHKQERKHKLNSDKRTYTFFLRLFIIMGMSWSLEIISYLVQSNETWANIFLVADYFNWSQGIIIFVLFILKPSTLKLLRDRIKGQSEDALDSEEEVSLENTKYELNVM